MKNHRPPPPLTMQDLEALPVMEPEQRDHVLRMWNSEGEMVDRYLDEALDPKNQLQIYPDEINT